jgi:hypothetical protein
MDLSIETGIRLTEFHLIEIAGQQASNKHKIHTWMTKGCTFSVSPAAGNNDRGANLLR